jgi:saccharopine dehydrogenase (NAD+, L-lysine-forming)
MDRGMILLVLGGYGQTGRVLCRYLLQETGVHVIVAGRRLEQAQALADELKKEFPPHRISARHVDAADIESLHRAFLDIDFVLVAASTTQWAKQIAEAALAADIDYLDIYFQQDVYLALESLQPRIKEAGRCFITQAGFHPGLPALYIRKGAQYFDRYDSAIVAFAMNVRTEMSESVYELIDAMADYRPEICQNGEWKTGTYKDAIRIDYGPRFGVRSSAPLDMVELKPLPKMLGVQETGVFTPGFNWFTDYLVFPLLILSQQIRKGALRHFWARLLVFGINRFSSREEGVVFLLQAQGEKDGKERKVRIVSEHDDVYAFTVIPVIACLKQYFDGSIRKAGLWMMGHIADPDRVFDDMEKMNVRTQIVIVD